MTEIEWLGGRVTKVPELAMGEPPDLDRVFCMGICVGIGDGGGFRNACGGENPVGRGLFVMLDIASQHGSTDHLRDGPTG